MFLENTLLCLTGVVVTNDTHLLYLHVVSVEQMQVSCKCIYVDVTKHLF